MKKTTIEDRFSASMLYASKIYGRGFQARVSERTSIDSSNLNSIINSAKGTKETVRREILYAVTSLMPDFPAKKYDDFLALGQWILEGKPPWGWTQEQQERLDDGVAYAGKSDSQDFISVKKASVKLSAGSGNFVYEDGFKDVYHSSPATTILVYQHVINSQRVDAIEKI